jgi:hydroxyethylthiazole kinase
MGNYPKTAGETLKRVRAAKPLIHSITNYVVMNSTANVLLAAGASPVMAHATEEVEELALQASAVVINIGTLSKTWIDSMVLAVRVCRDRGIPYVLDPVGAGATDFRTQTTRRLIREATPTVIRGNASEIMAIAQHGGSARGVDTTDGMEKGSDAARELAISIGSTVAVTGSEDFVTDGEIALRVRGGHPLLTAVTGTGCAADVLIAAFLSQEADPPVAAACALAYFGVAAQKAADQAAGPGSFWVKVIDELHGTTPAELQSKVRIDRA